MRKALYRIIAHAGVPGAWRTLGPDAVTILTYHGFTDRRSFAGVVDHQRMRLHVDAFRRHVEHLVSHYRVVSLSSLIALYREKRPAPKRAVVLTFDDGYRSTYGLAYPVLREYGVPAALFVATDFVFEKRALWHDRVEYALDGTREPAIELRWGGAAQRLPCATIPEKLASLRTIYRAFKRIDQDERDIALDELERLAGVRLDVSRGAPEPYAPVEIAELREMVLSGLVEVGCHTKTHAVLSRCSRARLESEIRQSKITTERSLSRPCDLFCYPNGTRQDFDSETRRALVEAGFTCALTTVSGRNGSRADAMELRRIGAPPDAAEFALAVSGIRSGLARAYHTAQKAVGRGAGVPGTA